MVYIYIIVFRNVPIQLCAIFAVATIPDFLNMCSLEHMHQNHMGCLFEIWIPGFQARPTDSEPQRVGFCLSASSAGCRVRIPCYIIGEHIHSYSRGTGVEESASRVVGFLQRTGMFSVLSRYMNESKYRNHLANKGQIYPSGQRYNKVRKLIRRMETGMGCCSVFRLYHNMLI